MKYEIEKYQPEAGKLLIKPFKHRTRTVTTIELDEEKNKDKDPLKDEMETMKVTSKAPYEMQLGTIIASGDPLKPVGSVIVYSVKFVKEFDLFKGIFLMSNYDVMGTYLIETNL